MKTVFKTLFQFSAPNTIYPNLKLATFMLIKATFFLASDLKNTYIN